MNLKSMALSLYVGEIREGISFWIEQQLNLRTLALSSVQRNVAVYTE